jgi:hypothetical protein
MHAEKREWIAMPTRNNPKDAIVGFPPGHAHSALLVNEDAGSVNPYQLRGATSNARPQPRPSVAAANAKSSSTALRSRAHEIRRG